MAIKTRNITLAVDFYSLLGLEPTAKFKAGPARAAWLEQLNSKQSATVRIELIEVPSYVLNESDGMKKRAVDLMQRQDLLGLNHIALDVTAIVKNGRNPSITNLADYLDWLNEQSVTKFGKTLRVALRPQQQIIGQSVYELAFIYDADGSLIEFIRRQDGDLQQVLDSGWEPWDGTGFVG
jgi:hypothetical protein